MKPELSVIIPVFQEAAVIQDCLRHLDRVTDGVAYEVIVVDGDATGSTLRSIPVQAHVRSCTAPLGRGSQMNAGAALAQADVLLFLHADTRLPPHALTTILQVCQRRTAGAFDLAIASSHPLLQLIGRVASWRSRLTRIPYGDQAIFMGRQQFVVLGGYPSIPIMEDVALMQALRRQGKPIQIISEAVTVSARRWEREGILRCTLRNWMLMTLYSIGVPPTTLANWYRPAPDIPQPSEA